MSSYTLTRINLPSITWPLAELIQFVSLAHLRLSEKINKAQHPLDGEMGTLSFRAVYNDFINGMQGQEAFTEKCVFQ